jgi:hypothetical protein
MLTVHLLNQHKQTRVIYTNLVTLLTTRDIQCTTTVIKSLNSSLTIGSCVSIHLSHIQDNKKHSEISCVSIQSIIHTRQQEAFWFFWTCK